MKEGLGRRYSCMNEYFICLSYVPMEMMKRVGLSLLSPPRVLCQVRENWVPVRID